MDMDMDIPSSILRSPPARTPRMPGMSDQREHATVGWPPDGVGDPAVFGEFAVKSPEAKRGDDVSGLFKHFGVRKGLPRQ